MDTFLGWEIEYHRKWLGFTFCRPKAGPYRVYILSLYWPFFWSWIENNCSSVLSHRKGDNIMEMVTLKNGSVEAKPLVLVTMISLNHLIATDAIAFYELVQLCRNSEHRLFGNTANALKGLRLIEQNGQVHDSVRNIVLSGSNGDGIDLSFGSPIA